MYNTNKGCCDGGGCCGEGGCCGIESKNQDQSCDCRNYLSGLPNPHPWTLIGFK